MKVKNVKLEWKILHYDWNNKQIVAMEIFHSDFTERIAKKVKKGEITNLEELKKEIRNWAVYHYMSRSEYEIVVGGLFAKSDEDLFKIDAFFQINMNLDRITEYVNRKMQIFEEK